MFRFKNDSPSKTSNPRVFSATFDQIFHSAWKKLELFYSELYSALYIHFTVWVDCVGESEITGLANLITLILLYVSLDQRNQSSS